MSHTPGPWFWEGRNGRDYLCTAKAEEVGYVIVLGWPDGVKITEDEYGDADARLIAAAPSFYDAARAMIERHDAEAVKANFARCGCDNCVPFRAVLAQIDERNHEALGLHHGHADPGPSVAGGFPHTVAARVATVTAPGIQHRGHQTRV